MKNIFAAIPDHLDTELAEILVNNDNVMIERIISKGHASPDTGWYDQERNEWVLVLKGQAVLSFADGSTLKMKTGDYLDIPAHKKHRVDWTDPETETLWLTVFY